MQEIYGCRPQDVFTAIGPSICADCYEVSEDVAEAMRGCFSDTNSPYWEGREEEETIPGILARGRRPGKYQLDLWRACQRILLESGITRDHITVTNLCTCENSAELFSHRATGGKRGNQGAFLMLT
jgi:copper oxidase (laccase) domain-containing protein